MGGLQKSFFKKKIFVGEVVIADRLISKAFEKLEYFLKEGIDQLGNTTLRLKQKFKVEKKLFK